MKVFFVGYHNPHFVNTTLYREKAIKELGHDLVYFEDRDFVIPGRIRQRAGFLERWEMKLFNRKLARAAKKERPDLFMAVGGHYVTGDTIVELKKAGIKTVLWTTDAPTCFFDNIKATARHYDNVFCAGTEAVEILKNNGVNNAHWLPFACDPDYHHPVELTPDEKVKYSRDIVFVGSFYPNRKEVLEGISDMNVAVCGPYWDRLDKNSPLLGKTMSSKVNYTEWVNIYSAAKVVLVIHYNDGRTPCDQASPKLYEAMACGSFVLVDGQKDARALFEDKKHVVFFEGKDDLRKKIRYYLDEPDEREAIAREGRREVLEKHTYKHRIREMLSVMNMEG